MTALLYTMLLLYVLPVILLFTDQHHGTSDEKHIYLSISLTLFLLQVLGNLKAVLLSVLSHIVVFSIFVTIVFCVLLLLFLPLFILSVMACSVFLFMKIPCTLWKLFVSLF